VIAVGDCVIGEHREGEAIFLEVNSCGAGGNRHKGEPQKFQLLGKRIFTARVVKYWKRLP